MREIHAQGRQSARSRLVRGRAQRLVALASRRRAHRLAKSQTAHFADLRVGKCLGSGPSQHDAATGRWTTLLVSNAVQSKAGHTRERRHTHWCSRRRSRPQTRGHRDRSAVRSSACQAAPFIGSGGPSPAPGNHTTTNPLYTTTNALYNDTIIAAFSLEDVVSLCALVQHTTATPTSARSRDQPLTSRTTELCMHRQQAPTSSARCRSDSCYTAGMAHCAGTRCSLRLLHLADHITAATTTIYTIRPTDLRHWCH
jgi:hypothetical protein